MSQTILPNEGHKVQTPIDRMKILRKNYYIQLLRELDTLKFRKRDLIMSYRNTIKDIDYEIQKAERKNISVNNAEVKNE